MRTLWILTIVGALSLALGCGPGGGGGAEGAAKQILDGMLKGNAEPFLDHIDFDGMYKKAKDEGYEGSAEDFEKMMRDMLKDGMEDEVPEGAEYKVEGTEEKEGMTIVKLKVKKGKDEEWDDLELPFEKVGGKWKITAKCFEKMTER